MQQVDGQEAQTQAVETEQGLAGLTTFSLSRRPGFTSSETSSQPAGLHSIISPPALKCINDVSAGMALDNKRRRRPAPGALELDGAGEVVFKVALVVFWIRNNWQVPELSTQYTSYNAPVPT